ncbi:MAG: cysteine dioxygenase [Pseudomonadota bacterium]
MSSITRFRDFVGDVTDFLATSPREPEIFSVIDERLHALVTHDDWLPDPFAKPHPDRYQQYLLHCDPLERFSVVSFVWGPGHKTPVHDHTVWGLIGVMRGEEACTEFALGDSDLHQTGEHRLGVGEIDHVSPTVGDIHEVVNSRTDGPSVSIHIYGANIGAVRRHVLDRDSGAASDFISGYSSDVVPNLWDRSGDG